MEFTSRGDFAHEVFGALNKYALAELPGMILGVGSVTDAASASLYMSLGANFIVTKPIHSYYQLPYEFGNNLIERVFINGQVIA